jgi:AraC-like DNA-binding protein
VLHLASELLVVAKHLDINGARTISTEEIATTADRWVRHQRRRGRISTARYSRQRFVQGQRPESLKVFLRTAPQSVFLKYKNEAGVTPRLRRCLRKYLGQPDWPVLEDVAREFHMSPTTLRRRLEAEFTSYQGIKDEVRRDAAIHHLCSTDMSVGEIGALVGFQEASAFRRAFKAWSGVQPGEYRRQAGGAATGRAGSGST